jgi:hypothetical protein
MVLKKILFIALIAAAAFLTAQRAPLNVQSKLK